MTVVSFSSYRVLLGISVVVGCGTHAPQRAASAAAPQSAAVSRPASADRIVAELERDDMQRDLEFWLATLEAVHPDPFANVDRVKFIARVRAIEAGLPARQDAFVYYGALQRLAAALHDSHTQLWYPRVSNAYVDNWWSLETSVRQGKLVVGVNMPGLAKGTELLSINQRSAPELLLAASALTSAERPEAAQIEAWRALSEALWLAGERAPFRVKAALPSGEQVSLVLEGRSPLSPRSGTRAAEKPYLLRWVDTDVGYLVMTSMVDVDGFTDFIAGATSELRNRHARGLIVDLRENGGGNTVVGERLLERITRKPYRMVAEKHWRVSKQYQAQMTHKVAEYVAATPGTTLHYGVDAQPPEPVAERYLGPVCFLIGPNTVSAAMMLANAAADYHLATLIGEATTSPPNYFGEVYRFELPLTHLQGSSSVARFVRANGDATNPEPVLPDIPITPTLEQWSRGEDPALARALTWIATGS